MVTLVTTAAAIFRDVDLDQVRQVIRGRQDACDVDTEEAGMFEEGVAEHLVECGYDPLTERVWIPSAMMAKWYGEVYGTGGRGTSRASRAVNQQIEEGAIERLRPHKMTNGRGFLWTGVDAAADAVLHADLTERMEERWKRHRPADSGGYVSGGAS